MATSISSFNITMHSSILDIEVNSSNFHFSCMSTHGPISRIVFKNLYFIILCDSGEVGSSSFTNKTLNFCVSSSTYVIFSSSSLFIGVISSFLKSSLSSSNYSPQECLANSHVVLQRTFQPCFSPHSCV